jgi:transposase
VVETNGKVLVEFIKGIAGTKYVCLEEGTHSEWLYELFKPQVQEIVVVQPRESAGQKNDSIDAWALAEQIRQGKIQRPVFKAPGIYSELRAAVRAHQALVSDSVRAKNRLKAIYRSRGLPGLGTEVYKPDQRETWLKKLPSHRRKLAEILSNELDVVTEVRASVEQWLQEEAAPCAIVKLLTTAPGIGTTRAAQIVAIVVSPTRFRTRQQFWSYCGLGIVTRSSSDWVRDRDGTWVRRCRRHLPTSHDGRRCYASSRNLAQRPSSFSVTSPSSTGSRSSTADGDRSPISVTQTTTTAARTMRRSPGRSTKFCPLLIRARSPRSGHIRRSGERGIGPGD